MTVPSETSGRIVLIVRFDPMRLSTNRTRRMNRFVIAELTKVARTSTRFAWIDVGRPRMTGRVLLTLTVRRGMKLDDDSAISGCKAIRDEVGDCLGLPSDRGIVQGPVLYDCGHRWRGTKAHVEVWIDPMEELNDDIFRTSRAHRESEVVGLVNHLLAKCDLLLATEGCDLPAFFRAAVLRAHADLARFVGAGK